MDVRTVLQDPDFWGLPNAERIRVLDTIDPNFAGLPDLREKMRALDGLSRRFINEPISDEQVWHTAPDGTPLVTTAPPARTTIPESENAIMDAGLPFLPASAARKIGRAAVDYAPDIAGALTPAVTAGIGRSIPVAAPIAGMLTAGGGMLKDALTTTGETVPPPSPEVASMMEAMESAGVPSFPASAVKDFMWGAGGEVAGTKVADWAGKLFAPAAGKIPEESKAFIRWAQEKGLPYSIDTVNKSLPAKASQALADYGAGRFITQGQREKLAKGAAEAASEILDTVGLEGKAVIGGVQASGGQMQEALGGMEAFKKTHASFNEALHSFAPDHPIEIQNTMDYLKKPGVLQNIKDAFMGESAKEPRQFFAAKRLLSSETGTVTREEFEWMLNNMWRKQNQKGWYESLMPDERKVLGEVKGALMADMEFLTYPQTGQTLRAIREAADAVAHEAKTFVADNSLAKQFLNARNDSQRGNAFLRLFTQGGGKEASALKDKFLQMGREDLWDGAKASYLTMVFENATKKLDSGDRLFEPASYIRWYDKFGKQASDLMPEHAPALKEWVNISQHMLPDMAKMGRGKSIGIGSAATISGLGGGFTLGNNPLVAVPLVFSPLAALGTMGSGNWAFLKPYLMKESISPFTTGALTTGTRAGVYEAGENWGQ